MGIPQITEAHRTMGGIRIVPPPPMGCYTLLHFIRCLHAPRPPRSAQPQSILAVPHNAKIHIIPAVRKGKVRSLNCRVSRQCPTAEYPCSAHLQNIQPQVVQKCPPQNVRTTSQQCPTTEYPCSVQTHGIPTVPNRRVSQQCPTAKYPRNAQPQTILAVPNRSVSKHPIAWVLPPLSNSWITIIIWLYIALNRTPNIDCYWVGAVPTPSLVLGMHSCSVCRLAQRCFNHIAHASPILLLERVGDASKPQKDKGVDVRRGEFGGYRPSRVI